MKRYIVCCVLLAVLLPGCRQRPASPPDAAPAPEGLPTDTVTYLPSELLDALEARMLDGTCDLADFDDIRTGRPLTEEEAGALPSEVLDSYHITDALFVLWESVDYDNDGVADIFAEARWGMGRMGLYHDCFFRGRPDAGFEAPYFDEMSMSTPLFIAWGDQNYFLVLRRDQRPDEAGGWSVVDIGMRLSCFADGWEQERVYLNMDPDTGALSREVYTRGVNTEFPLPAY